LTLSSENHAFIVRIWWEPNLTRPNGRPLWRGQVQHVASGRKRVFQSLDELARFIQEQTGELEEVPAERSEAKRRNDHGEESQ